MIINSNPLLRSSGKSKTSEKQTGIKQSGVLIIPHPFGAKSFSHQLFHFMLAMAGNPVTGFHGLKQRFLL
jgi:hypothetical protein